MASEYIIYADESVKRGPVFSNFYGGALVSSADLLPIVQTLKEAKESENLFGEIKWQRVTSQYLEKYLRVMDVFFDLVAANQVKTRIMFTQNRNVPYGLTPQQKEREYHLLYYQFIKHAFGLGYAPLTTSVGLRIYLDRMPDSREANA